MWPTHITYKRKARTLTILYDNGENRVISAERLRVESPSAEVQGHNPDQKITVTGKESVQILAVEPVGHYAVRLIFDDGHQTGLYTWDYLYSLG